MYVPARTCGSTLDKARPKHSWAEKLSCAHRTEGYIGAYVLHYPRVSSAISSLLGGEIPVHDDEDATWSSWRTSHLQSCCPLFHCKALLTAASSHSRSTYDPWWLCFSNPQLALDPCVPRVDTSASSFVEGIILAKTISTWS